MLIFLDKIEWEERIILRKGKDTWLWIYRLKATGSLSKAVLKNDPLWWNGISWVSRCYLSLRTQYQFVIAQTGGDIKAELRPSFVKDFSHKYQEKNIFKKDMFKSVYVFITQAFLATLELSPNPLSYSSNTKVIYRLMVSKRAKWVKNQDNFYPTIMFKWPFKFFLLLPD